MWRGILAICLVSTTALSWELVAGLKAVSNLSRRGATLYDSPQFNPLVYAGFFENRLQFLVTSLEYADFLSGRWLRGRSKVQLVSDKPLYTTGEPRTIRNSRESTVEWTQTLEFFAPSFDDYRFGLDLRWVQDVMRYGGSHFEATPRVTICRLGEDHGKALVAPQLFATLGFGTRGHNQYQYGPSAEAGFNHWAGGVRVLLPGRYDPAYWALEASYYEVLGGANRRGVLLDGKTSGWRLEVTAALKIL